MEHVPVVSAAITSRRTTSARRSVRAAYIAKETVLNASILSYSTMEHAQLLAAANTTSTDALNARLHLF